MQVEVGTHCHRMSLRPIFDKTQIGIEHPEWYNVNKKNEKGYNISCSECKTGKCLKERVRHPWYSGYALSAYNISCTCLWNNWWQALSEKILNKINCGSDLAQQFLLYSNTSTKSILHHRFQCSIEISELDLN